MAGRSRARASISSATLNRNITMGRFRPLADEHRAGHGDAHQGIDVEIAVAHRDPALAVGRQPAGQDGRQRQGGGDIDRLAGEVGELGQRRQHPAGGQQAPAARRRGRAGWGRRGVAGQGLGRHAQRADRRVDAIERAVGMQHDQYALHQVEVELVHLGQAGQLLADQRFLGGAVHLPDAHPRDLLARTGLPGRGGRGRGRLAVPMAAAGRDAMVVGMVVPGMVMACVVVACVVVAVGVRALARWHIEGKVAGRGGHLVRPFWMLDAFHPGVTIGSSTRIKEPP
ncbi:hypothetical protein A7970_19665 [Bordetella pertussis]|nr:hypothetical protein A7970_19665 [Bordetella pertussis]